MTGPLAQQFAQVRMALADGAPPGVYEAAYPALSAIERHLQDMETALDRRGDFEARFLRDTDGGGGAK